MAEGGVREAWEFGMVRASGREREERGGERWWAQRAWNGTSAQGWDGDGGRGGRGWRGRDEGIMAQRAAMGWEHTGTREWAGERHAGASEDRWAEGRLRDDNAPRLGIAGQYSQHQPHIQTVHHQPYTQPLQHQPHIQPPHPDVARWGPHDDSLT